MRQAARELTDCLHFLRLPECILGFGQGILLLSLVRNVSRDAIQQAFGIHGRPGQNPIIPAARPKRVHETESLLSQRKAVEFGTELLHIIGMLEPCRCFSENFNRKPSEDTLPCRIYADPTTVRLGNTKHIPADLPDLISLLRPLRDAMLQR